MADVVGYAARLGVGIEDTVRYIAVAEQLRKARETAGMSVKEVASRLGVPQYRIRDAESNGAVAMGAVLEKYARLVGLHQWYEEWSQHNLDLARRISLRGASSKRVGRTPKKSDSLLRSRLHRIP